MTKKAKRRIKKILPWIVGGAVLTATGVLIYRKGHAVGYLSGVSDGMHEGVTKTIKAITDHVSTPNNFCIYRNTQGIPTFLTGVPLKNTVDAKSAIDMLEIMAPSPDKEIYENSIRSLSEHVFGPDKGDIISAIDIPLPEVK